MSSDLQPPMNDDIAISVRNLTKNYRLFSHPGDRIKQFLSLGLKRYHREFTALEDVSFDIKKGETVGIIGRNGAGKSTLLQLICQILKPTSGSIQVSGRILALLELGAGFNPEFTGRENVYFQGALTGFTQSEMHQHFEAIAEFADIGNFIDQPVRTYSSGMFVRLAFATTIHLEPDILILDEALAVGDTGFQRKCFERIGMIRQQGGVVLLVSHSMEQVAHYCDRAILLEQGRVVYTGDTAEAIGQYFTLLGASGNAPTRAAPRDLRGNNEDLLGRRPNYNVAETRWGDLAASIVDASIHQGGLTAPDRLLVGRPTELRFQLTFHADVELPVFGVAVKSRSGAIVFASNSKILLGLSNPPRQMAGSKLCVSIYFTPCCEAGDYLVSFGVTSETGSGLVTHDRRYDALLMTLDAANEISGNRSPACRISIDSLSVSLAEALSLPTYRA